MPLYDIEIPSLEYIAGLFDGEGCIMLSQFRGNSYIQLRVNVNLTNETIPTILHECFGGSLMIVPPKGNNKQQWMWRAIGKYAGEFLRLIYPYLIIKKEQAELGIKFQNNRPGKGSWRNKQEISQDKLDKELMGILNRRGSVPA